MMRTTLLPILILGFVFGFGPQTHAQDSPFDILILNGRIMDGTGNAIDNITEVIKVAEATGVPSCATHLKVKGADLWGAAGTIINLVNRARARGVEVWADQYPYNTSGTDGRTVLLPDWALDRDRWDAGASANGATEPNFKTILKHNWEQQVIWRCDDILRYDRLFR